MANDPRKKYRIIANVHNPNMKVVNVVAANTGYVANGLPVCLQAAGAATNNLWATVQASGGDITGLPTIYVSGYSAPA
jgi:hypothetical protein